MFEALVDLFQAWESVVLERVTADTFRIVTTAPEWLHAFEETPTVAQEIQPGRRFAYLENYLVDAEAFWTEKHKGRKDSDPWVETDASGTQWPLQASAVFASGKALLILRHLGASFERDTQTMQAARDNLLAQERLEEEVQRRTRKIRRREQELVFRLLAAAGFRDKETGAHIRRIGLYAEEMARALGWDKRATGHIRLAAPMHDIGKIGIPDRILLKPGKLNSEEREIMNSHTAMGGRMLEGSDIAVMKMGAEIARCHHERWDGTGYPNGLRGTDIPEAARIVALVDVYDALLHERVYKAAIPEDRVVEVLREQSGKHFDPRLVDLFLERLPRMREILDEVPDEMPGWVPSPDD